MMTKLEKIFEDFVVGLKTLDKNADVLNFKAKFLGKTGTLSQILKELKDLSVDMKKTVGAKANELKVKMEALVEEKLSEIEEKQNLMAMNESTLDITLLDSLKELGPLGAAYHPVNLIQREVEDVFISMGFEILDGPHIEEEFYNFTALNIPSDHPARDMQDTFWFGDKKHLLRTHTSCIQIRGALERKPPFQFVGAGKVFRCERTDASHEMAFHQMEGMMVGENVTVSHMIYFMKTLLSEVFKEKVDVRLRPGFFPFVEPGFELDIKCLICSGKGCSVCKQSGWLELLPCGMVHPNVLKAVNIDPDKYKGFAFGLGLDRLVMMKYGIDDIRLLHSADLRFSSQFRVY